MCILPFQGRARGSGRGLQLLAKEQREYRQQELSTLPVLTGPGLSPGVWWAVLGCMPFPGDFIYCISPMCLWRLHWIPFRMGKHGLEFTFTLRKAHILDFGSGALGCRTLLSSESRIKAKEELSLSFSTSVIETGTPKEKASNKCLEKWPTRKWNPLFSECSSGKAEADRCVWVTGSYSGLHSWFHAHQYKIPLNNNSKQH